MYVWLHFCSYLPYLKLRSLKQNLWCDPLTSRAPDWCLHWRVATVTALWEVTDCLQVEAWTDTCNTPAIISSIASFSNIRAIFLLLLLLFKRTINCVYTEASLYYLFSSNSDTNWPLKRGSTQREALATRSVEKRAYISHCNPPNIEAKMTVLMRAFKWYVIWPALILLWWS